MMKMTIYMKIRHHSIFNDLETDMDWERLRENPNEIPYYIPTSKSEYISILEKQSVNQKTILELKQIINQNNINNILSLGCGRVFEGTYLQMLDSLSRIKKLPQNTNIYCGHEYTKKNLEFCIKFEPDNVFLKDKKKWITSKLSKKEPTIPVTIEEELNTNIFLRCDVLAVKKSLSMENSSEVEIFKKLRDLKDGF